VVTRIPKKFSQTCVWYRGAPGLAVTGALATFATALTVGATIAR